MEVYIFEADFLGNFSKITFTFCKLTEQPHKTESTFLCFKSKDIWQVVPIFPEVAGPCQIKENVLVEDEKPKTTIKTTKITKILLWLSMKSD